MGTMTVSGSSSGLVSGTKVIGPLTDTGATAGIGAVSDATLASGDNTFSVPTGASRVLICLGIGPAATVKVRTNSNSSDAGLPIATYTGNDWVSFPLVSGVTSIILNSNATQAGVELSFI